MVIRRDDRAERGACSALLFYVLDWSSSPYINRFLSADTIVPGYANPQALNRYSYTFNSPLNYIDPSGHDPWWCDSNLTVPDTLRITIFYCSMEVKFASACFYPA